MSKYRNIKVHVPTCGGDAEVRIKHDETILNLLLDIATEEAKKELERLQSQA